MRIYFGVLWLLTLSLVTADAAASMITIPATDVHGTDVSSGPGFTLTSNVQPSDTLSLNVTGEVTLATVPTPIGMPPVFPPELACGTNAAGIIMGDLPCDAFPVGSSPGQGALLLGNTTFGFHQLFAATPANGLGGPDVPMLLNVTNVPLNSFGFNSTMPSGTVLQFRVMGCCPSEYGGEFTLAGQINVQGPVMLPEPSTWLSLGLCVVVLPLTRWFRRRSAV